jgi:hypothetical protein
MKEITESIREKNFDREQISAIGQWTFGACNLGGI